MQILEHAGDVATEKKNFRHLPTSKLHLFPLFIYSPQLSYGYTHMSHVNMEKANTKSALKLVKNTSNSAAQWSSTRLTKEELREKIYDKTKASRKSPPKENKSLPKENRSPSRENRSPPKEKTKPQEFKLHTQERAVKRTMFNYAVTTKLYLMELQKKREEKLLKMIEEEEIRMLRKEMVPRAQLMPYFDRPFFPKRSSRPLTIPREPSFHNVSSTCWSCFTGGEFWNYNFQFCDHHALKAIK